MESAAQPPSFREALAEWLRIGVLSFGGPAGQIALMHRILVEKKKWVSEARFLHALNFCMLLPGPEAQQLATYIGWRLHGVAGGLVAGLLFVAPGALVILALSALYVAYGDVTLIEGAFFGVKTAVIAIVVEAVLRIGRRALKDAFTLGAAACAFAALFFFAAPFPLVVIGAGLAGAIAGALRPDLFARAPEGPAPGAALEESREGTRAALLAAGVIAALWLGPAIGLVALLGADHVFAQQAAFFSKMAVVTFGGAYAVLAYVAQQAVEAYQWLSPGEMLDGLGLAETTPGPLVLVLEFVGFLGAVRAETGLDPFIAGAIGALIAVWMTFAPCFVWIFLGAPYIERLSRARALNAALATITAAVVGVILNLALWFSVHVLFRRVESVEAGPLRMRLPDPATLDPLALALSAAALFAMLRLRIGIAPVLGAAALAGMAASLMRG